MDENDAHSWDLHESKRGNLPESDEAFEKKMEEWHCRDWKAEDVRRRLQEMSAENLRIVAAQLYKMLPKKLADERRADQLIGDPQTFVNSAKVAKLPDLPDIDLLDLETRDFVENAKAEG